MTADNPTNKELHQRSVETLGLSVRGDEATIAEIGRLINDHQIGVPYSRNVLLRIIDLIIKRLNNDR